MAKAIFDEPGTDDFCVETWRARDKRWGYGRCQVKRFGKRINKAHILAWIDAHGRLPSEGALICHTCDNPPCVNPAHLYEGTHQSNMDDKVARGRHSNGQREKTSCSHGHEFTPENTYLWNGQRYCRRCRVVRQMAYENRVRAETGV